MLTQAGAHQRMLFHSTNPLFSSTLPTVGPLIPGVFEETGRFVAFKTVLRRRKNRETSISHGIGHGGFEVMFIPGLSFSEYFVYGLMINNGSSGELAQMTVDTTPVPGLEEQLIAIAENMGIGDHHRRIWMLSMIRAAANITKSFCSRRFSITRARSAYIPTASPAPRVNISKTTNGSSSDLLLRKQTNSATDLLYEVGCFYVILIW